MIRRFCLLFLLPLILALACAPARAQSNEVAATVSVVRVNPDFHQPNFNFNRGTDQIGFAVGVTHYGKGALGITGEVGASFKSTSQSDSSLVTLLAGPTLKVFRKHRIQPSVRALAGVGRLAAANSQLSFTKAGVGFAVDVGGAIDVAISKRFKLRILQADYLRTRNLGQWTNYARVGAGIVF